MAHDVFISYASEDKTAADSVCDGLEAAGLPCWIAPRNIRPSDKYDDAIIQGIASAKVMVVIFSSSIFQSQYVESEVERAFAKRLSIVPFRLENILPQGGLELYLSRVQWMDALFPPLDAHISRLAVLIQKLLAGEPAAVQAFRSALPLTIAPPPEPALPPLIPGFVGRLAELETYSRQLANQHLAVVCGMPGVGKTAFAAQLAARVSPPEKIFWHSFHSGESLNVLIWKLAGFLACRGQNSLWQMLQGSQQTGNPLPPAEVLIDYLFQTAQGHGYLLCLDNFQFVADDPLLPQFIERLKTATAAGADRSISALFISAKIPTQLAQICPVEPLGGLSPQEVRLLLSQHGLALTDDLATSLYAQTAGNAQFLILAMDALKHTQHPARLIERLLESENIEDYLIKTIDDKLTRDERDLLNAVSVFLEYPCSREAISAVLQGRSIRRTLNELSSRYLLSVTDSGSNKAYSLADMLQDFYYDLIGKAERTAMHRRAAEHYAVDEPDPLKAALHFQLAGEDERAAAYATDDVWAMLNLGQARPLQQILAKFADRSRKPLLAARLELARGQVAAFLGNPQTAQSRYEAGLTCLTNLNEDPAACLLRARLYRGLAELSEGDQPRQALEWLQRGLDSLPLGAASSEVLAESAAESATLRIRLGRVYVQLGELALAKSRLQQGLAELPPGPSRARITAFGNLGSIACLQGNPQVGLDYYRQVLDIAGQINDRWSLVEVQLNIGIELVISGDLPTAANNFLEALEQARHLGSLSQQSRALSELGILHTKLGDYPLAENELVEAIALARQIGQRYYLVCSLPNLADVYLRQERLQAAAPLLEEAEQLAKETSSWNIEALAEINRLWALLKLARQVPAAALQAANLALEQARQLEERVADGVGLRVLGQVQLALGQSAEAQTSYAQSLALLEYHDPYEAARTCLEWGALLLTGADHARGLHLLQEAEAVFQKLGAVKDLEAVQKLLNR